MRVQEFQNVVVRSMVQLLDCRFLTMLVCQPPSVLFVTPCKQFILDLLDAYDLRHAIVKWGRRHELRLDFVPFGTI
jgi:hypothetical protein